MVTRGMRMKSGEGSVMRNFIVCTVYLIYPGNKSKRLRSAGHVGKTEEDSIAFEMFNGKRP